MAITVANNQDGRLETFITQDNQGWANVPLQHIWQTAPNNGWSGWDSLGGNVSGVVVAQNQDDRLEAFVVGLPTFNSDGPLLHIWQTAPNNGWSGWESLGGSIGRVAVARYFNFRRVPFGNGIGQNQDGRLEVFGFDNHRTLFHIWQTGPNNGWSGWETLSAGYQIIWITVGKNLDGRLEVFGIDTHGTLLHLWQTAPNNGWSDWAPLGSGYQVGWTTVGQNADGRLEVFPTILTAQCCTYGKRLRAEHGPTGRLWAAVTRSHRFTSDKIRMGASKFLQLIGMGLLCTFGRRRPAAAGASGIFSAAVTPPHSLQ